MRKHPFYILKTCFEALKTIRPDTIQDFQETLEITLWYAPCICLATEMNRVHLGGIGKAKFYSA